MSLGPAFSANKDEVYPPVIGGTMNAIKSAYAAPSVKRFVLTSSTVSVAMPEMGQRNMVVTQDTFNDDVLKAVEEDKAEGVVRMFQIYGGSRTAAEKGVLKYHLEHKDERPDLTVNIGKFTFLQWKYLIAYTLFNSCV